jgi:N utilization substance protein A
MLVALGENDVKSVEDLAGCATDDLVGWTERKDGETKRIPAISTASTCRGRTPRRSSWPRRIKAGWIEAPEPEAEAEAEVEAEESQA